MTPFPHYPTQRQRGFTLVEAIVVMVITGILAGIMVLFIRRPVQNYVDAAGRAEMSDVADLALRRMARELHGALPNSIRTSTVGGATLLEFIPTKSGGTYQATEDDGAAGTFPLDFGDATKLSFTVIGNMPAAPFDIKAGDYIVVYNLGTNFAGADAYATSGRMNRATINSVTGNNVTLASNPFAVSGATLPNASPTHRFNAVSQPVTFRCAPNASGIGELRRYWGYDFQASQADPETLATKSSALLANYVTACSFSASVPVNLQHGLVTLVLTLGRANSDEAVSLTQQVTVENTP
jgi:MSHA biogenesis protein MshO